MVSASMFLMWEAPLSAVVESVGDTLVCASVVPYMCACVSPMLTKEKL
jgi:hypothetical protein